MTPGTAGNLKWPQHFASPPVSVPGIPQGCPGRRWCPTTGMFTRGLGVPCLHQHLPVTMQGAQVSGLRWSQHWGTAGFIPSNGMWPVPRSAGALATPQAADSEITSCPRSLTRWAVDAAEFQFLLSRNESAGSQTRQRSRDAWADADHGLNLLLYCAQLVQVSPRAAVLPGALGTTSVPPFISLPGLLPPAPPRPASAHPPGTCL